MKVVYAFRSSKHSELRGGKQKDRESYMSTVSGLFCEANNADCCVLSF
jgi:hypothetical protein